MVRQLSVFLENSPGQLAEVTDALAKASVDLLALSIADTADFGILRIIVNDLSTAIDALTSGGYTYQTTEVTAMTVPDVPGGLAQALRMLTDNGISVEYIYSFVRTKDDHALIILKTNDPHAVSDLLTEHGFQELDEMMITGLV